MYGTVSIMDRLSLVTTILFFLFFLCLLFYNLDASGQ